MYACEMEICYYNNMKYFVGIKFHFYRLATMLGKKKFLFFLSTMGRFSTNFIVYYR
jgi:hypothetical protein